MEAKSFMASRESVRLREGREGKRVTPFSDKLENLVISHPRWPCGARQGPTAHSQTAPREKPRKQYLTELIVAHTKRELDGLLDNLLKGLSLLTLAHNYTASIMFDSRVIFNFDVVGEKLIRVTFVCVLFFCYEISLSFWHENKEVNHIVVRVTFNLIAGI